MTIDIYLLVLKNKKLDRDFMDYLAKVGNKNRWCWKRYF